MKAHRGSASASLLSADFLNLRPPALSLFSSFRMMCLDLIGLWLSFVEVIFGTLRWPSIHAWVIRFILRIFHPRVLLYWKLNDLVATFTKAHRVHASHVSSTRRMRARRQRSCAIKRMTPSDGSAAKSVGFGIFFSSLLTDQDTHALALVPTMVIIR